MRAIATRSILLACLLSPVVAFAQEKPSAPPPAPTSAATPGHYRLVYRVLQIGENNKVEKAHVYSTIASSARGESPAQIRNGDRVPITTDSNFSQYQYQDVGTNIDAFTLEAQGKDLALQVSADLTAVVKSDADASRRPPILRHISWRSYVIVPLGKPTIIFTSDNVSDSGRTELELTATSVREP